MKKGPPVKQTKTFLYYNLKKNSNSNCSSVSAGITKLIESFSKCLRNYRNTVVTTLTKYIHTLQ